jgi:hypothetical protein
MAPVTASEHRIKLIGAAGVGNVGRGGEDGVMGGPPPSSRVCRYQLQVW